MLKKLAGNTFVHTLLLAAVALFTFLPTLEMFFYLDEWGNLYEWTHFPYKFTLFTSHIFYLLFRLFGTDATGYFAVGTAVYALSVVVFYFFVSHLLKNKILGLIAGLLYATTPVGSGTVVMIWTYVVEGGYPLTIMLLVLLYLSLKYFRERRIPYYLLVFFGFMLFLELEPRRVFMFLPILFLFDYAINYKKIIPSPGFFVRQIILFAGFIAYYKYTVTLASIITTGKLMIYESSSYDWKTKLDLALSAPLHIKPLITFANILLGGPSLFLTEHGNLIGAKQTHFWVVVILSIAVALLALAWRVKREWGLLLLFSLGWIYVNILGIYVFSSPGISETTHRTLSLAAPAYALFVMLSGLTVYTLLKRKRFRPVKGLNRIFAFAFILLLSLNFAATRADFETFNDFRSRPARAFFRDLKRFYPTFPPDSIIYIETSKNPQVKHQLGRIYGGNNYGGGATIAVFYEEIKKEEIDLVREYKDVEKFVRDDSSKIDRVFAFYFDEQGLTDITDRTRSELKRDR